MRATLVVAVCDTAVQSLPADLHTWLYVMYSLSAILYFVEGYEILRSMRVGGVMYEWTASCSVER